jgi:hypothetical protein
MNSRHSDTGGRTPQTDGASLILEYSPYPPGRGSDVFLCGTCGMILALRPSGTALRDRALICGNCGAYHQGEGSSSWRPPLGAATPLPSSGRT